MAVLALGAAAIGAAGTYASSKQSTDFAARSYRTRYQTQVKDLQKAGLNPMLAIGNAPPSPPQPTIHNVGEGAVKGASAAMAAQQMQASTALLKAQANKETAIGQGVEQENYIRMFSPEYTSATDADPARGGSGQNAVLFQKWQNENNQAQAAISKTRQEVRNLNVEEKLKNQTLDYNRDIQPLLLQEQKYINAARREGLPELEAKAAFWRSVGQGGVWVEKILEVIPGGEAISRMLKRAPIGRKGNTRR